MSIGYIENTMTAKDYYQRSVETGVFEYVFLGNDGAGRRLYQRRLQGVDYGSPRALLSFGEYMREVKAAQDRHGHRAPETLKQPQRFVAETRIDGTQASMFEGFATRGSNG